MLGKRNRKILLIVAVTHVLLIAVLLFFPSFRKPPEPVSTIQWIDIPTQATATPLPQESAPAQPTSPERSEAPTPEEIVDEPQVEPAPLPTPEPPPKPVKREVPTPKKTVETPKPKPKPKPEVVKVDLTKVVKKTTTSPATGGNTNTLTERLKERMEAVRMKSSQSSSASYSVVNDYHLRIRNALYRAWNRPGGGSRPLEAVIELTVKPGGQIVFLKLVSSSGYGPMDDSVIAATRNAGNTGQPLPSGMGNPDYTVAINFVLK